MPNILKSVALALSAGVAALATIAFAAAAADEKIPAFASPNYGGQTNVADWQEPTVASGHGPIRPDPGHPFVSNAEAGRLGIQPTLRIGDAKDPVLKPWAAKLMEDSNVEAQCRLDAQSACFRVA